MSINAVIKDQIGLLIKDGRLCHLPLLVPGEERVRTMFVSQEVGDDIWPPFGDHFDGIQLAEFREKLDSFVRGDHFTVAEDPYQKPSYAMLARVDPVEDEIWDIRCTAPNSGIRCFGAFAGLDHFVALTWNHRDNLDWQGEIEGCKAAWTQLFGSLTPFKGGSLDDYISNYRAV